VAAWARLLRAVAVARPDVPEHREAEKTSVHDSPKQFPARLAEPGGGRVDGNHHHPVMTPHLARDEPAAMSTFDLLIVNVALKAIGHAVGHEGVFALSWEG
jgi:hypothetical protein